MTVSQDALPPTPDDAAKRLPLPRKTAGDRRKVTEIEGAPSHDDIFRELLRAEHGATIDTGCPTTLRDGHHWFRQPTGEAGTFVIPLLERPLVPAPEPGATPDEQEVHRCVHVLATLHSLDPSTSRDARPAVNALMSAVNIGFLVAVGGGCAVGYLILCDEDADGRYETLGNVWTASGPRRTGVARRLLARARKDQPTIVGLEHPITRMGRAWIGEVAPDLLSNLTVPLRATGPSGKFPDPDVPSL